MEIFDLLQMALPTLIKGVGYTLIFAVASMVGGLVLGFPLAVARILPSRLCKWPATVYVSLIRGTPLLVQIFVIYYGLPSIGVNFSPLTAGILALSLNASAYLSESLRGAIIGVDKGQWAASYSIGLNYWQTLRYIVIPQAIRIAVPSMSNTLISLIKDTSLVSVITVTELMLATKEVIAVTFRPLPLYLAAAAIYWGLSICFERVQNRLEKKLGQAHRIN
ncbi:amino acid ABC transporter permease [Glaciimonas immobilis]|uniref:Putative glutamine transport system permease protein GlnP n=1 Tax=Glaciimonas immobilis TaxID=728004 RepID=A0A840RPX4_9BURK|nr:amino acid ABC transporter permease [Glaciimonas immobilis]KAF3999113.1 amino acid ABC transporter permease [Glaciimonas immobilis]MBB5198549.1 cystine transport system permease protein [Glaciimonas immobilis]